jgi:hypothetical protein
VLGVVAAVALRLRWELGVEGVGSVCWVKSS